MSTYEGLENRLREIDEEVRVLRGEDRRVRAEIDALRMAERPTYPTRDQRDGIRRALDVVRSRTRPASHLGDPAIPGDYTVTVAGDRGAIYVHHGAPYSKAQQGHKLWGFTGDEREALLDLVRNEGFVIVNHWAHDEGLSIVVLLD